MSQAEELLNGLSEEEGGVYDANSTAEPHIVITADKTVIVPAELRKIATQHEHNVKTVTFDCPRYWDGRDLAEMVIRINYKTPNNVVGQKEVENVTIDTSDNTMIHFDWTITKNVTKVNGTLSFLVCGVKTNADGFEENHWNSDLNREMYVTEGFECTEAIIEEYPDVIADILTKLKNAEEVGLNSLVVDSTLTKAGYGADAKAVGDKFAALPISVAGDGYTDISGMRKLTHVQTVKDGQIITITTTLQGGKTHIDTITLDEYDRPISGTSDGTAWTSGWEGFDIPVEE